MFQSIVFPTEEQEREPRITEMPDYFRDLNLDQIVLSIAHKRSGFGIEPLFFTPLRDVDAIVYRQEVMGDLDDPGLFETINQFAGAICDIQGSLTALQECLTDPGSYHNNHLTRGRFLNTAERYCDTISALVAAIDPETLHSRGLREFWKYVSSYSSSQTFLSLATHIKKLRASLATVQYCMLIKDGTIRVRKYEQQEDHSVQIIAVFQKFAQGTVQDYRHSFSEDPHAEHVEAAVLNMVASWYKDIFEDLSGFCGQYVRFMDKAISAFAHEVQFYLAYQDYMRDFCRAGLHFCYPKISTTKEHIYDHDGFDLALAGRMLPGSTPVTNDFRLDTPERIIVITGPNQGGKTTFARAFGQWHHLGCIGYPVPGTDASLFLFDRIYTHFGREEDLSTMNGQLQDDLVRLRLILDRASQNSIMIFNEIFSSTTLQDAVLLGSHMMDSIASLGALAVSVTFLDEVASHGEETVSMMSTVQEEDPTQRTYKVLRQKANGMAYAVHIAQKHRLTYEILSRRLSA
jgi:DNA mismatch repair protein MutS